MSWRQVEDRKAMVPWAAPLSVRVLRHVQAEPLSTMPVISATLKVPLSQVSEVVAGLLRDGEIERVPYREL